MTDKSAQSAARAGRGNDAWREVPLVEVDSAPASAPTGRVGPITAAVRHPWIVAIPIIVIALAGVTWGLVRTPTYTAQSEVLVGNISFNPQSVPGYVAATQQLAGTYARLVGTQVVVDPVASQLGLPPDQVGGMLSASVLAQSSVVIIEAKGKDPSLAQRVTSEAAQVLVSQASQQQGTDQAAALLKQFNAASLAVETAKNEVAQLTQSISQVSRTSPGSAALASLESQLLQKQADLDAARLTADAISQQYQKVTSDVSDASGALRVIEDAAVAGSDRNSKIQLGIAAALLLGGVMGLALATWVANSRHEQSA